MCHYEIMWKNTVELCRPQMTIWHMCITCWITKATNTHSVYVILIALPLQQWLHNHAAMFCSTYIILSFTAYITWCIYNLQNNMLPIINGQTLGIGAEWCQFTKEWSVSGLFVNLWLNKNNNIFQLTSAMFFISTPTCFGWTQAICQL